MENSEFTTYLEKKEQEPKQEIKIGIVADLHATEDPEHVIKKLTGKNLDYTVIAGDVVGSNSVNKLVDKIKTGDFTEKNLSEKGLERYNEFIKEGLPRMRAIVRAKLDLDDDFREEDLNETKDGVNKMAHSLEALPNPSFLAGNVEIAIPGRSEIVQNELKDKVSSYFMPSYQDIDKERGLIFWPSLDFKKGNMDEELEKLSQEFIARSQEKKQVIILCHEQIFRGPSQKIFKERVPEIKDNPSISPSFPNPSRLHILKLLRSLPKDIKIALTYGHLHGEQDLIQKGLPYLNESEGSGLEFRLYGLGARREQQKEASRKSANRRIIEMFQIPAGKACVLTSARDKGYNMEIF